MASAEKGGSPQLRLPDGYRLPITDHWLRSVPLALGGIDDAIKLVYGYAGKWNQTR